MLNEHIIKAISNVKSKEDYESLVGRFKTSEAPLETREEAIRELEARCPQYVTVDKLPSRELFEELKDGEADIDDIGTGY